MRYGIVNKHKIKEHCISGLITDGGHHKQWFLEEVIKMLGYNLDKIKKEESTPNKNGDWYEWEDGIAP